MRNAFEYPDPRDVARVSQLRTVAEMALLAENIDVLAELLVRLPRDLPEAEGGGYNVAHQAGREVLGVRNTGALPPWLDRAAIERAQDRALGGPTLTQRVARWWRRRRAGAEGAQAAQAPGHHPAMHRERLRVLYKRLANGDLTDDSTGALMRSADTPTPS